MATKKIVKPAGQEPDALELSVAQALADLEQNVAEKDLKTELHELQISAVKEVVVGSGKKAIIVFVPVALIKAFRRIQPRLVRELEKKFSGSHIVFVAQRRVLRKPSRNNKFGQTQPRPRNRTLTAVHEAILDDLVFPPEITGKRTRVKLDGSRLIKVHLEKKEQSNLEHKVDTFSAVYKKLTGKDVIFEFPAQAE